MFSELPFKLQNSYRANSSEPLIRTYAMFLQHKHAFSTEDLSERFFKRLRIGESNCCFLGVTLNVFKSI